MLFATTVPFIPNTIVNNAEHQIFSNNVVNIAQFKAQNKTFQQTMSYSILFMNIFIQLKYTGFHTVAILG